MKKGLSIILMMFLGLTLHAQSKPAKAETEKKQQEAKVIPESKTSKEEPKLLKETPKTGTAKKDVIKTVPVAKSQHAKPVRINQKARNTNRPEKVRPARNPRPAARAIKPGRGN